MSEWSRSWWVILFFTCLGFTYFHSLKGKKEAVKGLKFRLEEMEKEKWLALQKRDDLRLHIASQNDPTWIEMILIRDLGVVPEGFVKVYFKK